MTTTHWAHRLQTAAVFLLLVAALPAANLAEDTYTATNPVTGATESIWSAVRTGAPAEIFYSTLEGTNWTPSQQLTSDTVPDRQPHLAFTILGERKAVWWRDGTVDVVLMSSKPAGTGAWSAPGQVSDGNEDARAPVVSVQGGATFVAFEGVPASGGRKVVVAKQEGPDPWLITVIAVTTMSESVQVRIHNEAGHMWADWVDSGTHLGWAEYASGSWSVSSYEPYAAPSDIEAARIRIRVHVLGL